MEYAYYAYAGGRFELLQRGYFPDVSIFDLKSAYPSVLAELPDFNYGDFVHTDSLPDDYDFGWFLCNISTYNRHLSPFLKRVNNLNLYPNGMFCLYMNLSEIKYILKHFRSTEIEIIDGYYWKPYRLIYPMREEIQRLYRLKELAKDEEARDIYKTILVSYYGKQIQVNPDGGTGCLFNPLGASECTARTRIKLMQMALEAGVENIIGFSTDAAHLARKYNYPVSKELGRWDLDITGEGIYLFSDIYTVWNKERTKDVFRGMIAERDENGEKSFIILREMLERMGKKTRYPYTVSRPVHIGEALMQGKYPIADINTWKSFPKTFDINGDRKRLWENDFMSAFECFEENYSSEPLEVKESTIIKQEGK
jgi:hypothetical protein